ncbi:coatomer subunit delta [Microthyrium microscopicum]|uniref:Coatomer subunit delta n=1 Tax=Microthyrium microscopicum TaxID=703497 RepID=A0A6A6UNB7_9PEZI|nr:coatomer subunit delta [Microthyrium microscopicum]
MVVLAASICTRGGKAVLSRQFREMQKSRIEGLLASFPKLAASGSQHTTVEQDNVRFVYQPLDELYMVLITNRQSNILQDIDSLHLFAQVVSTICKSLDEREILRHSFELLSAFDELVTLGYRENLTLSQIKTFLDMESHEERIQEIIARNKELEASEERKRKAKQLEMQRKEMARSGRGMAPRAPNYPTYTPAAQQSVPDTYDSYKSEQKSRSVPVRGKGMQLGKKSKTTNAFEQIRGELGPEAELSPPPIQATTPTAAATPLASSSTFDREPVHITIAETISAKVSREGSLESFEVKGDLHLRITDPKLTQVKLNLAVGDSHGAQLMAHPKVDKALFKNSKVIQIAQAGQGFPANQSIGVMRWKLSPKAENVEDTPITFNVWVNDAGGNTWNITVEYEWGGSDPLKDVLVSIPYQTSEPAVSSFDAVYEVSGDSIDWTIGSVDDENASGSFEFEAQASDESEFFPMAVQFSKSKPYVDVDVSNVSAISTNADVVFSKEVRSVADNYRIV